MSSVDPCMLRRSVSSDSSAKFERERVVRIEKNSAERSNINEVMDAEREGLPCEVLAISISRKVMQYVRDNPEDDEVEDFRRFGDKTTFNQPGRQTRLSRYNAGGDDAIVIFVIALINAGIHPESIGVITNYKYDMTVLLQRLRSAHIDGIEVALGTEVATVDAFQGRQKDIIILHFVAASENTHIRHPFGHVKDPRRLYVGLTRAREYQFMFGNATS